MEKLDESWEAAVAEKATLVASELREKLERSCLEVLLTPPLSIFCMNIYESWRILKVRWGGPLGPLFDAGASSRTPTSAGPTGNLG